MLHFFFSVGLYKVRGAPLLTYGLVRLEFWEDPRWMGSFFMTMSKPCQLDICFDQCTDVSTADGFVVVVVVVVIPLDVFGVVFGVHVCSGNTDRRGMGKM